MTARDGQDAPSPLAPGFSLREVRRFFAKVEPQAPGCWIWTAYVAAHGYGRLTIRKKARYAHRVAYEMLVGPIPEGLELDHICRVRCCVNPDHLEPVTRAENYRRGRSFAIQHWQLREARQIRWGCRAA